MCRVHCSLRLGLSTFIVNIQVAASGATLDFLHSLHLPLRRVSFPSLLSIFLLKFLPLSPRSPGQNFKALLPSLFQTSGLSIALSSYLTSCIEHVRLWYRQQDHLHSLLIRRLQSREAWPNLDFSKTLSRSSSDFSTRNATRNHHFPFSMVC